MAPVASHSGLGVENRDSVRSSCLVFGVVLAGSGRLEQCLPQDGHDHRVIRPDLHPTDVTPTGTLEIADLALSKA